VKPTAEGLAVLFERLTVQRGDVEEIRALLEQARSGRPTPAVD